MKLGPAKISTSWDWWRYLYVTGNYGGLFRNKKHLKGGRWGFYILGFEFGNRDPGNWFGTFLNKVGLWPF